MYADETRSWIISSISSFAYTYIPSISFIAKSEPSNVSSVMSLPCQLWHAWAPGSISTLYVSTTLFLVSPFIDNDFAICHMHATEGRKNSYSIWNMLLTEVPFYYVPFPYTYLQLWSLSSPTRDKVLDVFYTILIPMLNPIIYHLKNKVVIWTWEEPFRGSDLLKYKQSSH